MDQPENKPIPDVKPTIQPLDISNSVDKVVNRIEHCIDYQSLYAMEEDFNSIGLTIQTTSNKRMTLCKLIGGKPVTNKIIDDFIFVGSLDTSTNELSDRATSKICDFVRANAGQPNKIENISRVWRNGLKMYESTISIMNENKLFADMLSEDIENIADSIDDNC